MSRLPLEGDAGQAMDGFAANDRGRVTLALAGDTMLGRGVAGVLASTPSGSLFAPEIVEAVREADLAVSNLECCISTRGSPWPERGKPFFFRAPPAAAEALSQLGVDCVTLANNHALDFGPVALLDTIEHLRAAGVAAVGAGADLEEARSPVVLEANGFRLAVIGVTDHPEGFEAGPGRPGVALARLARGVPDWLLQTVRSADADAVLVTPHWGPNMATRPLRPNQIAAQHILAAGATVIAGHSAHLFQGVDGPVLYDLGDFIDDYATDPVLRNDLGLLFLLTLERSGPVRLEALPLKLEYCHTRPADGADEAWIHRRFRRACAHFGTRVTTEGRRLVIDWTPEERRTAWRRLEASRRRPPQTAASGSPGSPGRARLPGDRDAEER
ncbi:MAG TPA: CapA family protein [Gaiellaceae bacterium]|nr:CapA family protein [Gaiellaceae bacterium]